MRRGPSLALILSACTGSVPEAPAPPLFPDELPALVATEGQARTLDDYIRPGLNDGRPAILWIAVQASGEVATWVGLNAPWRDEGCADGCYAVEAPVGALVSLKPDGPPALVAIDPQAPLGDVVGVLSSLERIGIEAHVLVAPDGASPKGSEAAGIQVLPARVGQAERCGGRFSRLSPFSSAVSDGCDALDVTVFAKDAPPPKSAWGPFGMSRRSLFRCDANPVDIALQGIPDEAVRPNLEPIEQPSLAERAVERCAAAHGAEGAYRFRVPLRRGVPETVRLLQGAGGPFAECVGDLLEAWRFTTDATGELTITAEVACTPL